MKHRLSPSKRGGYLLVVGIRSFLEAFNGPSD